MDAAEEAQGWAPSGGLQPVWRRTGRVLGPLHLGAEAVVSVAASWAVAAERERRRVQAELPDATTTLVRIPSKFNKMLWVRAGACQALSSLPAGPTQTAGFTALRCRAAPERTGKSYACHSHGACASCDGPLLWSSRSGAAERSTLQEGTPSAACVLGGEEMLTDPAADPRGSRTQGATSWRSWERRMGR